MKIPYYPTKDDAGKHQYEVVTFWEKIVADYCGISLFDVQELDYVEYLMLRRDAFIFNHNKTEAGQEYLDNAYRLEQTAPDKSSLRSRFGERR